MTERIRPQDCPLALDLVTRGGPEGSHGARLNVGPNEPSDRYVVSTLTDPDRHDAAAWTKASTSQHTVWLPAGTDPVAEIVAGMKPQPGSVVTLSCDDGTVTVWERLQTKKRRRFGSRSLTMWLTEID